MNESFKNDPSLATSARAAKESGSYLCASNVTPTAVRFIVSVFLCLLCYCRMSSTLSEKSAEKNTKTGRLPITHYKQKPAGSDLWPVNRCIPNFNAAKFSIKLFYFIYLTVYVVSQQDKYEIMTETRPFKNS